MDLYQTIAVTQEQNRSPTLRQKEMYSLPNVAAAFFSRKDGSTAHTLSHTYTQETTNENSHAACIDWQFFPGSQTLKKKLIYVTWQLFYNISLPLNNLKGKKSWHV